jgi:hypothetical protein
MKKNRIDVRSYLLACEAMGVDPYAALVDIKKIYRAKVKKLHPDKNANASDSLEFQHMQDAYEQILMFRKVNPEFFEANALISHETNWKKIEQADKKQRRSKVKDELKAEYNAGRTVGTRKKHEKTERIIMNINQLVVFVQWFILPPICIYTFGMDGVWMAIAINVVGFFFTVALWRNRHDYAWGRSLSVFVKVLRIKR